MALDVLEYISELTEAMTNCLALLRDGGVMKSTFHMTSLLELGKIRCTSAPSMKEAGGTTANGFGISAGRPLGSISSNSNTVSVR